MTSILTDAAILPHLELPERLVAKSRTELREPASVEECCQRVRQVLGALEDSGVSFTSGWLSYSPAGFAVMYLRWAKWDVPKAQQRMVKMDKWHNDAFPGEDINQWRHADFQPLIDTAILRRPARKARCGAELITMRPLSGDHKLQDPMLMVRYNAWGMRNFIHDKDIQVDSSFIIYSFGGCSSGDIVRWMMQSRHAQYLMSRFLSECSPFRVKQLVVLHPPSFFSWVYAFAKPFISKKLRSRVRLIGHDPKELYELVDPAILPEACGGQHPDNGEGYWEWVKALHTERRVSAQQSAT